ncbi:DNA-binding MarR family transcriptional regulator [Neorhizobium sp. 2083]|uniref:MarR family winged helix-turn-helix transcriptional regulator n=1 Tax=Neorhizobium sp. 2083 TaxID=2817762 RepID=UPI002857B17B|nr:MarR family winged helix-turn-helix transcriptional regulator [Neorhizobium sp. 2083]MDR6820777.1 DNA-binding MarR family transcriptional regulator [Neorhizobium sp. 2083]
MTSTENVQITHIGKKIRELHGSLIDIVTLMNQPQRDEALVREAGIALDRALFPLLVGIERRGPIGIVDLAAGVGRDYTTVSRQVAKLESLGLAERRQSPYDRRVNEAVVTPKGKAMTDKIDAARERIALAVFASWDTADINDLVRLMRRFADAMGAETGSPPLG